MRPIVSIIFLLIIYNGVAQEDLKSEVVNKLRYDSLKIGDSLQIHFQVRDFGNFDCAGDLDDNNRAYNPKTDLLLNVVVTDKFPTPNNNYFIKVRINKIIRGCKSVKHFIVLLEDMKVGKETTFNLYNLKTEIGTNR